MSSQELNDRILQLISKVNQLKMDNAQISGLEQTNDYNYQRIQRYVQNIQELRSEKMNLQLELGNRGKEMLNAIQNLEKAEQIISRLVSQQNSISQKNQNLQSQNDNLSDKVKELSHLLYNSEKVAQTTTQDSLFTIEKLEQENDKLKKQYTQILQKHQKSQFDLNNLEDQISNLRIELNDYKRKSEVLEIDNRLLAQSAAAMYQVEPQYNDLEQASCETEILQQNDKINDLEQQITSLENDNDLLSEEKRRLELENEHIKQQLIESHEQLTSQKIENQDIQEVEVEDDFDEEEQPISNENWENEQQDIVSLEQNEKQEIQDEVQSQEDIVEQVNKNIDDQDINQTSCFYNVAQQYGNCYEQEQYNPITNSSESINNEDNNLTSCFYNVAQQYGNCYEQEQYNPINSISDVDQNQTNEEIESDPVFYYQYAMQYGQNEYSPVYYYEYSQQYDRQ